MISSEARNQFLILSKSATGKACESFISQLLSHPQIFIFKEFLDLPNVQEVFFFIKFSPSNLFSSLKTALIKNTITFFSSSVTALTMNILVRLEEFSLLKIMKLVENNILNWMPDKLRSLNNWLWSKLLLIIK